MLKRILDIILSLIATILFLPFGIPIAAVLRFTGEGEIFYLQERIGKGKRPFQVYKFATMLKDSPNLGAGDITVTHDTRVLPVGRFLRKTKLNEVPQVLSPGITGITGQDGRYLGRAGGTSGAVSC
jgi:lipopolysaccharide/colanic/teichoic acid biosynthesis glycosyltransferase